MKLVASWAGNGQKEDWAETPRRGYRNCVIHYRVSMYHRAHHNTASQCTFIRHHHRCQALSYYRNTFSSTVGGQPGRNGCWDATAFDNSGHVPHSLRGEFRFSPTLSGPSSSIFSNWFKHPVPLPWTCSFLSLPSPVIVFLTTPCLGPCTYVVSLTLPHSHQCGPSRQTGPPKRPS